MDAMAGRKKRERPKPKMLAPKPSEYARSLGLPVFPIGIGLGLMTASWFKTGVFLFYAGTFWLS